MKRALMFRIWICIILGGLFQQCDSDKTIPEHEPVCLAELTRHSWSFAQGTLVRAGLEADLYGRCALNFFPGFTPGFTTEAVVLDLQPDGRYFLSYQLPLTTLSGECRNNLGVITASEQGNFLRICPDSLAFMPNAAAAYGVKATLGEADIWSDEVFLKLGTYNIEGFRVEFSFRRKIN